MRHMHTQRAKRQTRFTQTEERKSPENPQFKCLSASFTLSLEEIFHGAARTLQWSHRTPHGDSIQEALKVQIPPGWPKEGQKLNLEGKTDAGGKHFIQVQLLLEPSKEHRLEGNDLVWRMHLYPWEFILGCQPKLDGLSKPIVVQIPPHSRPEQRLRLKGMGLPLSDGTKGDLWIELALRWPSELNHFQKTALEHLKTLY
jgi:DnaJ-class molecular chaperone